MRVLIASSATGGHIYPALAIAEEVQKRDLSAEILFVGAKWEIGKELVGAAGYRQVFISVSGFDRKNPINNIKALANLVRSSSEVRTILRDFRPDVCLGTGGHVAGPIIRGAKKAGIRTLIQEQNVIPGMANKLAEKYADRVFAGFEETAKHFKEPAKVTVSGNPVRTAFAEAPPRRAEYRKKIGVPEEAFCVLFFGGSQGAEAINEAAAAVIEQTRGREDLYFMVVTGRPYFADYKDRFGKGIFLTDYSEAICELYAAADLIVSRAGALTVSEIAVSGRASILIPSPNVTNNHQYYNAKTLADAGAAVLLTEDEARGERLSGEIKKLAADRGAVMAMEKTAEGLARPDAVTVIVDEIFRD